MCKTKTAFSTCKNSNCAKRCEKRVSIQGDIRIPVIGVLSGGKIYPAEGKHPVVLVHSDGAWAVTTA